MTRSPVHVDGRRWQAVALALVALGAGSATFQERAPAAGAAAAQALLPAEDEHELRYARALALARHGDLAGAVAALEALGSRSLDAELAGHVASDVERIRRFGELRARHLSALAETGGTLRLELEGRDLTFRVQAVEPERVVFQSSVFGVNSLPLARLDSLQVAKQIPRDLDGDSGLWLRLYPYVLIDEARGLQLLRRDCRDVPAAEPLLEDARSWYPRVLDLVDAADHLEELAGCIRDGGRGGGRGEATLERVSQLLAEHGDLPAIRDRLGALRGVAAACLESSFTSQDLLAGLHARPQRLEDGSLRLVYELDEPEELEDFRPTPGYPPERVAVLPALRARAGDSLFELEEGELVVAGSRSWKHVLPLSGRVTVRCRLRVDAPPRGGSQACFWMLGACDDGQESYVALQELGTALAVDRAQGFVAYETAEPTRRLELGRTYELELACDGERVRTRVDGELVKEIPAGGRSRGEVFFLVHSDAPVRFDRLAIEVAPGGLSENGVWIEERLAQLGFPPTLRPDPAGETGVQ